MKILAVDYGDSRTGLATCDRTEFLTTAITPQITLKARNKVAARVCEVAEEIGAELIVIGLPLNMDGTEGERAAKSRKLAKTVELWSGLPVRMSAAEVAYAPLLNVGDRVCVYYRDGYVTENWIEASDVELLDGSAQSAPPVETSVSTEDSADPVENAQEMP